MGRPNLLPVVKLLVTPVDARVARAHAPPADRDVASLAVRES
jgi:hypothetical protein